MRFYQYLLKAEAPPEMRAWVGHHGMRWMWENCTVPGWMFWLLDESWWHRDKDLKRRHTDPQSEVPECLSWPVKAEIQRLLAVIRKKFPRLNARTEEWYLNFVFDDSPDTLHHAEACNFLRSHIQPGRLSELSTQFICVTNRQGATE